MHASKKPSPASTRLNLSSCCWALVQPPWVTDARQKGGLDVLVPVHADDLFGKVGPAVHVLAPQRHGDEKRFPSSFTSKKRRFKMATASSFGTSMPRRESIFSIVTESVLG